jgi:hypothetical protein
VTLPALSIEGAEGFCEGVYRELEMLTDSAPDPEETEYYLDRQIFSVERSMFAQETEIDAQKWYTMDDVLEGQTWLSTETLLCPDDLRRAHKTQD